MKLTNEQLKQIIREELEVVLTNEEAGEIFGDAVQRQLEEDEAKVEEGHCPGPGGEPPPREPADIVMALEKAMRALGDALDYMRGEHEDALGDVAGDMADQAAVMNVGPMQEAPEGLPKDDSGLTYFVGPNIDDKIKKLIVGARQSYGTGTDSREALVARLQRKAPKTHITNLARDAHDAVRFRALEGLKQYVKKNLWPRKESGGVQNLDWVTYGKGPLNDKGKSEHYQNALLRIWNEMHGGEKNKAREFMDEFYMDIARAAKPEGEQQ
jgi:hypothetical protein